jgi:hypothetical protein
MKYAFVLGTSAYIVPHGVISYADHETSTPIIKINSIYHDNEPGSFLSVDLDIKDMHGNGVIVNNNTALGTGVKILAEQNSVKVLGADGAVIIHVHQIDDEAALSLQLNITAELERNAPIAVIRIFGDFITHDLRISAENEKLFINDDGYATSALAGNDLRFTTSGVVL